MARILSPVVGNTVNTVKNSAHFAAFIRSETLDTDLVLVSLDVVSLFTNIPVDLVIKVAKERLRNYASLGQRTSLPAEDIVDSVFLFELVQLILCLKAPIISRSLEQRWVLRSRQ